MTSKRTDRTVVAQDLVQESVGDDSADPTADASPVDGSFATNTPSGRAPLTKAEIRRVFYGLMLGGFLSAVNQTVVATALPTIGRDLGDLGNLTWVIIAYLLSSTVVAPLYGKLSDIHGRRAMMLTALGLFIAGSAAAALASNMAMLIAARALQGVGGGGITPLVQTTVADMVTPRERGHYQAYMGGAWVVAGVLGPALGGVIADQLHWSVIFWLNVPFGLLAALLTSASMKRLPRHERPHKLDMLGAGLMTVAAAALLLALTSGGTRFPWLSPTIFGLIGVSVMLALLLAWWLRRAPEPFLPLTVLANPVMRLGTLATSCALGVMTGFMIYLPLYYQVVHKLSATDSGLALIPVVIFTTPGSMMSGRAMMYLRHYKISALVGLGLTIAAVAALVRWPAMPLIGAVAAAGFIGFGVGTVFPIATVSIQNAVLRHQVGTATGAMNFFRALASALVVAGMGAIVLAGLGVTPERGTGAELVLQSAGAAGVDMAQVFRWVFAVALAVSIVAFVAVLRLEERPLRGPTTNPLPSAPDAPPAPAE
jgi:EmrB/QacA subfamily drug resistance transporter